MPKRWLERLLEWEPASHPMGLRVLVAVALTLAALALRLWLAPAETGGRFLTLTLAATLSAIYGGFAVGLFSTVLSMVLVNFFMIEPFGSLAIEDPTEAFWLNLWFLITQLVVVGMIWVMQIRNLRLREAHQQAQASQRRFLDTFNLAAAGITHVGLDGRLLRVNQTFCDLVGYPEAALQRMGFQDITHPDDVGPDEQLLAETLRGERNNYSLGKRYVHAQGHIVWVQLTVALVRKADGEPDYLLSVAQDISSLKAAEAALRRNEQVMEQAQNLAGFMRWQADIGQARFQALGDSFRRLNLPRAEFDGQELLDMVHPDDRERFYNDWTEALRGVEAYDGAYRTLIGGEDRWFVMRAEFERNEQGQAVSAAGIMQDITGRKRAELEVRRLNASLELRIQDRTRELKDAYDELESYSYAVAHDLRSPLRIINGFAQALEEDNPDLQGSGRAHLDRIKAASRKMGEFIDGLLLLSQYGRGELHRQPVNLSAMATRQIEELQAADPLRVVEWSVEPELSVQADPALIEALLQNLLHNAWKYSAAASPARVEVFAQARDDGQRAICVRDNGAGFDIARAGKLFQPFQRLHKPGEFEGLGIGLATVRRIVLRHGGELHAQGAPGQGATFAFTLPEQGGH